MNKQLAFIALVMDYYQQYGRHDLPWRKPGTDAYHILVSEIMLQQTQVSRVIPKYEAFLEQFPDMMSLADAPLDVVLGRWLGLGYNRRARYLWLAAQTLRDSQEPWTEAQLTACKGIGVNTARAVLVYAYNLPLTYVETNIRSVIIHHFFAEQAQVSDTEIAEQLYEVNRLVIGTYSFQEWYWALMDYGSYLKRTAGNAATRSSTYRKQSRFKGSKRQLRGKILRLLHEKPHTPQALATEVSDPRLQDVIDTLQDEKLVRLQDNMLMLYNGFDDINK